MYYINGENLSIKNIDEIIFSDQKIALTEKAKEKILKSRKTVEKLIEKGEVIYGLNTGFGKFSTKKISADKIIKLQENLIISHAAGTGDPLDKKIVKTMILLRVNALAKGYSGIKLSTLNTLIKIFNKNIIPLIFEQGSVGASGDLIPLAHMVLPILGKGKVRYKGKIVDSIEALQNEGIKPIKLNSKEGLALINGTQMMSAIESLSIIKANRLADTADMALALSLEGLKGIREPFDERIHKLRPHPGQVKSAYNIRKLIKNSNLMEDRDDNRVQDSYTLRCGPQIHGATRDSISHSIEIVEREINSVTDNPLIFPEDESVLSGGNFHGQPLALSSDYLGMAVSELGNVSERRTAKLVDGSLNNGLETFLTEHGGLNSGYMIAQYTSASIVSENKILANPSSTDSIPTSANQEDHVSMGSISARNLYKICDNVAQILAIELLTAAQAVDLRTDNPKQDLGVGTYKIYKLIREKVDYLDDDRILYPELKRVKELIESDLLINEIPEMIDMS
ncbi:MAG: histidine ammonia-lyase [Halanaerobiales bacterium]|nr:histidine ammonia-lyase [Halanaerobiales bacterium]